MNHNEPGESGFSDRDASKARASDREREQRSAEAIRHISLELAELVDLRGRVATARAILARGGDRQAALDALDGTTGQARPGGGA